MSCWSGHVYESVKGIECHAGLYIGVLREFNVILVCT